MCVCPCICERVYEYVHIIFCVGTVMDTNGLLLCINCLSLVFVDLMLQDMNKKQKNRPVNNMISAPKDFRVVSSIVDADLLPDTVRRVKLLKHSSDRPLGFYIRDGMSVRVTPYGLEKVPGIFISRLVPGGLAEGTGLLAVNDEILEVNAIEVLGKSLDQVTDMMVANSQNLIITVKPASQPPSTPRANSQSRKMTKSAGGGGGAMASPGGPTGTTPKPIGNIGAKSMGDLPSVGATPPSHGRLASVSTANGQKPDQHDEEDRSLKRHSVSGVLDST